MSRGKGKGTKAKEITATCTAVTYKFIDEAPQKVSKKKKKKKKRRKK